MFDADEEGVARVASLSGFSVGVLKHRATSLVLDLTSPFSSVEAGLKPAL